MKGALPPQPELFCQGGGGSPGIPAPLFLLLQEPKPIFHAPLHSRAVKDGGCQDDGWQVE